MTCLVLAAGFATRLYPLTKNFPKPLLPIGEKTILDWLLDDLDACGAADNCVLVSNHKFVGQFNDWAAARPTPIRVLDDGSQSNETRLGAVCDLQFAIEKAGLHEDLLVAAGDNLLDFSLASFLRYAAEKKTSCTLRYYEADEARLRSCGVSEIGGNDRLLSLEEKPNRPKSHWCTPPFYYYTANDAAKIPAAIAEGCGTDAPGSLAAWMCRHSVMHSMEMPGRRYDIGNIESYEKAKQSFRGIIEGGAR